MSSSRPTSIGPVRARRLVRSFSATTRYLSAHSVEGPGSPAWGFGLLLPLKETQMTGRHRPAQLFRFDADKYEKLKKRGFNFEL